MENRKQSRPDNGRAKKPYRKPKLTRYGNLKQLTAGVVSMGGDAQSMIIMS